MAELVIFAGTTEGRELSELAKELNIDTVCCVATEYGEELMEAGGSLRVNRGKLGPAEMAALIKEEAPLLVLDATHPYADVASESIALACRESGARLKKVLREKQPHTDCEEFKTLSDMAEYLNAHQGGVFSSLGAKEAAVLASIDGAEERLWLRILPSEDGLRSCLAAGIPAKHIICMQGPFSEELNAAMFRASGAKYLLTKDTGRTGGFADKVNAAQKCGMTVLLLLRPEVDSGEGMEFWKAALRSGEWRKL
ncbi:MAG: precorrin-6A reductase [Firmicutes bacterium]|nr:precorrin-6A reductase [Bacillota bacterium]